MRYLGTFLLTALLPIAFVFGTGTYLQPLSGDLTRLGRLAERDFGWNGNQPVITTRANQSVAPKVIVLGDSFSRWNFWQSVSMERGSPEMLTFHWDDIGYPPTCLREWVLSLRKQYPSVEVVILQTIERAFALRFATEQSACPELKVAPIQIYPITTPTVRDTDVKWSMPDAIYALKALRNTWRTFDERKRIGDTFVVPLVRPDLFSNRRSGLLVFYADDEIKKTWTRAAVITAVGNIHNLQREAAQQGLTVVVAAVPDKSTLYRRFMVRDGSAPTLDIWREMDAQGVESVDLKSKLVGAVDTTKDIYLPNDTHLGPAGFNLVGAAIAEKVQTLVRNREAVAVRSGSDESLRKPTVKPD